jgi:hypothetical protein
LSSLNIGIEKYTMMGENVRKREAFAVRVFPLPLLAAVKAKTQSRAKMWVLPYQIYARVGFFYALVFFLKSNLTFKKFRCYQKWQLSGDARSPLSRKKSPLDGQ